MRSERAHDAASGHTRATLARDGEPRLEWWVEGDAILRPAPFVGVRLHARFMTWAERTLAPEEAEAALAEALAAHGPLRRSVFLIWVSGEEKGLWGSAAWTRAPTLPANSRAVCAINVDMIGRTAPGELYLTPSPEHTAHNALAARVAELAPAEGFERLGSADAFWLRSDHVNFARNMGIPVAFLFAGEHEDYHRPTDTSDRVDFDKIQRVTRLLFRTLTSLQDDELGF